MSALNSRFDLTATVPPAAELGRVHFLGIGGIGMSGIARIMARRGVPVSGSDAKDLPVLQTLRSFGADAEVGFDPARLDGVDTVVASSAIRDDNTELVAARQRGLRVLHRSQALQSLMVGRVGACVAGTNGKTTTTSMLTVLLLDAGAAPSFAIGGELVGMDTNADDGPGEVFVAEADESDASFLVYTPTVSVVTNVQPDHLDFYGTPEAVVEAFEEFADRLADDGRDGVLVACLDDPGSARLAARSQSLGRRVIGYGEAADAQVRVSDIDLGAGVTFNLIDAESGLDPERIDLAVPGRHNALNAAAAYAAAIALGIEPERARAGLATFSGARRRFECRGQAADVTVYDDYAHNPAKVAAAVATGRQTLGEDGRLIVCFQPHLYSRTRDFAGQFAAALGAADQVVVLDVYAAREDPIPGVSGALVAEQVPLPAEQVRYVADIDQAPTAVAGLARPGDLVLTIGAGDVTNVAGAVLAILEEQQ